MPCAEAKPRARSSSREPTATACAPARRSSSLIAAVESRPQRSISARAAWRACRARGGPRSCRRGRSGPCAAGPPTRRGRPGGVLAIARRRPPPIRWNARSCGSCPRLAICTIAVPGLIRARESVRLNSRASTSRRAGAAAAVSAASSATTSASSAARLIARPSAGGSIRPRAARRRGRRRTSRRTARRRGRGSRTSRADCPAGRASPGPGTRRPCGRWRGCR